ncbi:MAG: DUF799 family lipoprotein [Deltaproteobacteria bacterium]|nr:DUF799 family lipoprotein [Deltaproteobacteria bacterium]
MRSVGISITEHRSASGLRLRSSAVVFSLLIVLALGVCVSPVAAQNGHNGNGNGNGTNGLNGLTYPIAVKAIAILPFENLSENQLAAELIKGYIKKELESRGVVITDDSRVDEFLTKRRIRYTGAITRATAREMGSVLGADAALIGAVNYYSTVADKVIVGVSCRMVSAVDGSIIWADNITYTGRDFEGFLGLGVVKSLDMLASIVVRDIVNGISDKFFVRESAMSPFEIERVIIYPVIGKAGQKRDMKVKFLPLGMEPEEVMAVVGDEEIVLSRVAKDEYEGTVTAPSAEGVYVVDITAAGRNAAAFTFDAVTKVVVDDTPPKITVAMSSNIFSTAKRGNVTIEPRLLSVDDIDEWRVEILDGNGVAVRNDRGYGRVPKKLIWRGENDSQTLAGDGKYTLKLMVTDKAGNEGIASGPVRIKNNPPVINVDVDIVEETVLFSFDYSRDEPIKSWQFSIVDRDGNTVKKLGGDGLSIPEKMEYPLGHDYDIRNLSFKVTAEDVAGNVFNLTKTLPSLFAKKMPFAKFKGKDRLWMDF